MYQNVLANLELTSSSVENSYIKKLINIGDNIMVRHRFGIKSKIDRLAFIKIKNLLPYLRNDIQTTRSLNSYLSALNA